MNDIKIFSALKYYFFSFLTLFFYTNFWKIPFVLFNNPVLIHIGREKFYVNNFMDIWVLKEVVLDKQYDVYGGTKKHWTVIDIGSGIGEFAIMQSKKVKKVIAFDANKNRIQLARRNIQMHKARNIILEKMEVRNLNTVFTNYGIKTCQLLKMDCEGGEYKIIRNTSNQTLRKINKIIMEGHLFTKSMRREYQKLKEKLIRNEFKLREIDNPVHRSLIYLYAYK